MRDTDAVHLRVRFLCFCNTAAAALEFSTSRADSWEEQLWSLSLYILTLTRNVNNYRQIQCWRIHCN